MNQDVDELVTIYATGNPAVVPVIHSLLSSAGIEYATKGERIQEISGVGSFGHGDPVIGPVEFLVRSGDAAAARALLDAEDLAGEP